VASQCAALTSPMIGTPAGPELPETNRSPEGAATGTPASPVRGTAGPEPVTGARTGRTGVTAPHSHIPGPTTALAGAFRGKNH
jgi:hypothetical protein